MFLSLRRAGQVAYNNLSPLAFMLVVIPFLNKTGPLEGEVMSPG